MDKYEKVRVLGKGTYGKAWLVRDRLAGELCVMKEIKVQSKQERDEALAEAELHSKMDHKHIIRYRELLRSGSRLVHIVLDYADGGDLQAVIGRRKVANQPFSEQEILTWLSQLCQALAYVHGKGMIHRDIKLANLFLMKDGTLKLGDFGIARVLERNAARMSARTCTTPVGTPIYMAPELCKSKPYGQSVDLWAVGCWLYEMMTFRPAFNAHSMEGLMSRIRHGRYNKKLPSRYSAGLQRLVHALLSVDANSRPSAKQVLEKPLLRGFMSDDARLQVPSPEASAPSPSRALAPLTELNEDDERLESRQQGQRRAAAARRAGRPSGGHGLRKPALMSRVDAGNNNNSSSSVRDRAAPRLHHRDLVGQERRPSPRARAGSGSRMPAVSAARRQERLSLTPEPAGSRLGLGKRPSRGRLLLEPRNNTPGRLHARTPPSGRDILELAAYYKNKTPGLAHPGDSRRAGRRGPGAPAAAGARKPVLVAKHHAGQHRRVSPLGGYAQARGRPVVAGRRY